MFVGESRNRWLWLVLLFPIIWFHRDWMDTVVQELDHCTVAQCDFVRHYAPQALELTKEEPTIVGGWFYPPMLAILLVPLTWTGMESLLWFFVNLCAVMGMVWCCVRYAKSSWWVALLVCAQSIPILHSLKWGQVSLLLSTLLVWGICGRSSRARIGIVSFCSALKLYPLVLVLPVLVEKRWKQVAWILVCFLVLCLLPFGWIGWDFSMLMWENVMLGARQVRGFASHGGGQSVYPVLNRLFHDGTHTQGVSTNGGLLLTLSAIWIEVMYAIVMCVVLIQSTRSYSRFSGRIEKTLLVWVTFHLFLSPGWHHYMSFLPFVLLWCFEKERLFSGIGLMCICLPVLFLGHIDGIYVQYSSWGGTFWGLMLSWISLCRIAHTSSTFTEQIHKKKT